MTNSNVLSQKQQEYPNVPPSGPDLPVQRPWVDAWSVKREELMETLADGTYTLRQLDIAISNDEYVETVNEGFTIEQVLTPADQLVLTKRAMRHYCKACPIGCEYCYERKCKTSNLLMKTEEVFEMLKEAKELGLKTVKFLGPGELMHDKNLFDILDFLKENDIKIGIFTKGLVLGDDEWAQKRHGMSALELCEKVATYDNVSILLSLTSLDPDTENKCINTKRVPNLVEARNKAFENLAAVGLNSDPSRQRLAALCAPVLRNNIDEVFDIYTWGLERNIPVVVAPTMLSGSGCDMAEIYDEDFKNDLVGLYVKIYRDLIERDVMSLEQVEEEGVSPYPGYVCNQFVGGMMIRKDGTVQACPGNDKGRFIYERDVRKKPLKDIWKDSMGYKMREKMIRDGELMLTQPCYAKAEGLTDYEGNVLVQKGCGSFKENFFEEVMEGVREAVKGLV